tara:strand:- start:97 stop:1851 length:1755 start_codon:yes stop_codon:yes gene_type:complete
MSKGYKIQMNDAAAVSQVINHLSTGIPKEMALRELVINGIEACGRNTAESDQHCVLVVKDHQLNNKLSVINTGGDFLSQKVFQDNLATLGKTGNLVGEDYVLDNNKGIGAKISYLPKARLGLLYRSVEKGEEEGIFARMCDNGNGIYHLPTFECEYTGDQTSWPICDSFSEYRSNSTTTEVVTMGDNIDQDTWLDFDQTCSLRKASTDGGTGYGVFRYLTHRLWTQPQAPVKVGIYEKSTGDLSRLATVNGLKSFMIKKGCKQYGTVNFKYNDKIDIVAHWSIIKDAKDSGYSSNWSASGYTGIAWKGEVYSDFKQHHLSVKKDLNDCGVIIKYNKVLIIFEIRDDVQLNTNSGRTELFDGDSKIDKTLLHDLFRENFPQKLREWQEENQLKDENSEDLMKQIAKDMKGLGFGSSKKGTVSTQSPLKIARTSNHKSIPALKSAAVKSKSMKKINSATNLRNYKPIPHREIADENAPLIEFHYRDYVLLLNTGSSVYQNRRKRILNQLGESCLVNATLEFQIKRKMVVNAIYTIFETSSNYADSTLEERKEKWLPQNLEANWNDSTEKEILKIIKRKNDERKKAA